MSSDSELHNQLEELWKPIGELAKHLDLDAWFPQLAVAPYVELDGQHTSRLVSEALRRTAGVCLKPLDADTIEALEPTPALVLVLFGDQEINNYQARKLRKLRDQSITLLPIVILSEAFFQVPEGELFGYDDQLDRLRRAAGGSPVVAFRERDFDPVSERVAAYFRIVAYLLHWPRFEHDLASLRDGLKESLSAFPFEGLAERPLGALFGRHYYDTLAATYKQMRGFLRRNGHLSGKLRDGLELIQRRNHAEAIAEFFPILGQSWMAASVGVEYLELRRFVEDFVTEHVEPTGIASLDRIVEETRRLLDFATQISFLGTFSSGKTTLINTLLWGDEPRLRTQAQHNTAILTEICFSEGTSRAELHYQPRLELTLLQPSSDEKVATVSPVSGTVLAVEPVGQDHVVHILDHQRRRHTVILNYQPPRRRIKSGRRVEAGEALSKGIPPHAKRSISFFSLFGRRDLQTLADLLERGDLKKARLHLYHDEEPENAASITQPKKILDWLRSLKSWAPERYTQDVPAQALKAFRKIGIREIVLEAKLAEDHGLPRQFTLDKAGWRRFQGEEGKPGLAEDPRCYLLVDRVRLFIEHDFLQLATLVDTPGLGSVTDLHDEITETYLLQQDGVIVCLVQINAQWEKEALWRLIIRLSSMVEETQQADRILILANVWRNQVPRRSIPRHIGKLETYLRGCYAGLFVCDLQGFIRQGSDEQLLEGYGGFEELKSALKAQLQAYGPGMRLEKVRELWPRALHDARKTLEERQKLGELEARQIAERRKKLKAFRKRLAKEKNDLSTRVAEILKGLERYRDVVKQLNGKKTWRNQREPLKTVARTINQTLADEDLLAEPERRALALRRELRGLGIKLTRLDYPHRKLGGLPVHALEEKIDSIIKNWPWVTFAWGSYRSERRDEMKQWFKKHVEKRSKELESYRRDCEKWYRNFLKEARKQLDEQLAALQDGGEADGEIAGQLTTLKEQVLPAWNAIAVSIDQVLNEET